MSRRTPLRIAIDSGGTFTDCVWLHGSTLRILKVFSTPADPAQAIAGAIHKIRQDADDVVILHGTTVGTNTLLQRKGARVAFVTTKGFEDSIEIGRQQRPKLYDFFFEREPEAERLVELARQIAAQRPQAIAVSLLFSFANPRNEQKVAEALGELGLP